MFINQAHQQAHDALKAGQTEEAIRLYTEALKLNPNHPDILSDRGVAYLHLENQELCMQDMNLSLELQPDYSYRYASRAFARNHFGDLDGAIEDYEIAVKLDPEDAVGHNNLGLLLEQKGYHKEAKERFERADKLSKMENELFQVIDELEAGEAPVPAAKEPETLPIESKEDEEEPSASSRSEEMKKLFTSRQQFIEFLRFIRNGFKLK